MARGRNRFRRSAAKAFSNSRRRYGGLEITFYTGQVTASIDLVRRQRLHQAAIIFHEVLTKQVLVGPRSGRMYKIPYRRAWYTASAPGEPPAYRTGTLQRSYMISPARVSDIDERVTIGTNVSYARILEYALERSHLMVAYDRARNQMDMILRAPYN